MVINVCSFSLEVCVDSVESAINAQKGGADRIELCSNLIIGGTTPPLNLFKEVKKYTDIPLKVMIRPRFGDFLYTEYEKEMMMEDVETFKELGADGIVFGILMKNGNIDMKACEKLKRRAGKMTITFHRAFDLCRNPLRAYNELKKLGIDMLLTSGQKNSCFEGKELLRELVILSEIGEKKKPEILIGAGLNIINVKQMIEYTGAKSFHFSAKRIVESNMRYRKKGIVMGLKGLDEYKKIETEEKAVKEMKEYLKSYFKL